MPETMLGDSNRRWLSGALSVSRVGRVHTGWGCADIAGATERELSIYPVTCADAGAYTGVVSNDLGSVTTLAGTLIVPDCP